MDSSKPQEDTIQNEYQMMDEKSEVGQATVTEAALPKVPVPPPPPATAATAATDATKEIEIPVYGAPYSGAAAAPALAPATAPTPFDEQVDTSMDVLVTLFTVTRLFTGIALINASGNMYAENPGVHYMIAGIFLFTSIITEFLAKAVNNVSFVTCLLASLIIVIGGTLAFDRRDINIDLIGILWFIASILLIISHSYDVIVSYGEVNLILLSSKSFALVGAFFFSVGAIIMYSLADAGAEDVYKFASMFTFGGIAYLIHAINMGTGHKVVLDRVFDHAQRNYQVNAGPLNPPMV